MFNLSYNRSRNAIAAKSTFNTAEIKYLPIAQLLAFECLKVDISRFLNIVKLIWLSHVILNEFENTKHIKLESKMKSFPYLHDVVVVAFQDVRSTNPIAYYDPFVGYYHRAHAHR